MSATIQRLFNQELNIFIGKKVKVDMDTGKQYMGVLRGIGSDFTIILGDASNGNEKLHRVFISGRHIVEMTLAEEPFDIQGLAQELAQIFKPENLKVYEDTGVIKVLDRFRVSEEGVEGEGPVAERIRRVWEKYAKH